MPFQLRLRIRVGIIRIRPTRKSGSDRQEKMEPDFTPEKKLTIKIVDKSLNILLLLLYSILFSVNYEIQTKFFGGVLNPRCQD